MVKTYVHKKRQKEIFMYIIRLDRGTDNHNTDTIGVNKREMVRCVTFIRPDFWQCVGQRFGCLRFWTMWHKNASTQIKMENLWNV